MTPKEIVKTLISYMGEAGAEVSEKESEGRVIVDVKVANAKDLIGEKGSTLFMIQHIVRRMAAKNISPGCVVDLDINNYKKMRESIVKDFAMEVAERSRMQKRAIELDPMPSMDRRIIHLTLSQFSDIETESMGEGDERYIVVRIKS